MDFNEKPADRLEISGYTDIPCNTIHVIFDNGEEEVRDILEFTKDGGETQCFSLSGYHGKGTVRFVFLPGSSFDMRSVRFS